MNSEKFVIVNAYGRSNRGDSVLLDECLDEIKSSKKNVNLHCIIFDDKDFSNQIDSDVTWSFRIGNTVSNGILAKIITMLFLLISVLATFKFFQWLIYLLPQSQRLSWKKIYQSDYVISAPGGYIHDTNFAYYIALMHIWLGVRFKKKVILAPQSIGPIDGSFSKKICQFVLKEVDVICARESYTYNFLINELFLEESKVFKTGDSAFWNFNVIKNKEYIQKTFEDIKISNLENNIFGITVVDWSFPKSTNPDLSIQNYIRCMAEIIEFFSIKYNLIPVIFNQVSDDIKMSNLIAEKCNVNVIIDTENHEPDVLRAMISESRIFLGTRFHSCIFAMMENIPIYALSYLPKTSYILNDLGLSHRQCDINSIDVSIIIKQFESDLENLCKARSEINNSIVTYRKNYARLSNFL